MHFLLFYTYVPDVLERRAAIPRRAPQARCANQWRAASWCWPAHWPTRWTGGAVVLGAVQGGGRAFARVDPYVKGGLVTEWKVRAWTTVVGDGGRQSRCRPAL